MTSYREIRQLRRLAGASGRTVRPDQWAVRVLEENGLWSAPVTWPTQREARGMHGRNEAMGVPSRLLWRRAGDDRWAIAAESWPGPPPTNPQAGAWHLRKAYGV